MDSSWDSTELAIFSYNSMRRFLPTVANVLRFEGYIAQAIGSWQEVPQGEGTTGQATRPMSLHYSDEQALSSCEAKRKVLELFAQVSSRHPQVAAIIAGEDIQVQRGTLTWQEFAKLARSSSSPSQLPVLVMDGVCSGTPAGHMVPQQEPPQGTQVKKHKKDKKSKDKKDKTAIRDHATAHGDKPGKRRKSA